MQYLIVRMRRQTRRFNGGMSKLSSDGMGFDDVENVVVESSNIADAVAHGLLGIVTGEGEPEMSLTEFKVLNVFPLKGCSKEDATKINQLAQRGLTLENASAWDNPVVKELV